jgi:hypothetical protein
MCRREGDAVIRAVGGWNAGDEKVLDGRQCVVYLKRYIRLV